MSVQVKPLSDETAAALERLQKLCVRIAPLLLYPVVTAIGFLAAFAPVFGTLRPLGVALAAAVFAPYALCAGAGAVLGYGLALPLEQAIPYLAGVLAASVLRTIAAPHPQKISPYAPAAAGALCLFATSSGMAIVAGEGWPVLLRAAAEGGIVFGTAYLLYAAFSLRKVRAANIDGETRAAVLFCAVCVVCGVCPYFPFSLSLAQVMAAAFALSATIVEQEKGGALMGVAVCGALAAANPAMLFAGFGIAAAAVITGFFRVPSRISAAIIFVLAAFIGVPAAPDLLAGARFLGATAIGAVIVCLLPNSWLRPLPENAPLPTGRASLTALSGRLDSLAGALSTIGTTLGAVCDRMPAKGETYADVCDVVTEKVCKRCARCTACWGGGDSGAFDAFNNLQETLSRTQCVTAEDLPAPLGGACLHPQRLAAALTAGYTNYLARRRSYQQATAARTALTEQYGALATALAALSAQVYREEVPDKRRAKRVEQLFCEIGADPFETSVSTDMTGRLFVNVHLPRITFTTDELSLLSKEIGTLCRCEMNEGMCRQTPAATQLTFAQKPSLSVRFGVCSLPAEGDVPADAVRTFVDDSNCAHVLLCDGMGTGKAAAIDGNLTAALTQQLLHAGFGAAEAARLVNVALSVKGRQGAEAGATIDAASVNLFTGNAQLFKAGAAVSYLVRQGVVTMLGGESLPIGILGSVKGRAESMQLQAGDMLVLVSDGALAGDADWLYGELTLAAEKIADPAALAETLANTAKIRTQRPDDITAVCLQLSCA